MQVKINEKGNLLIGDCDAVELTEKYGTPLQVIDENILRAKCREYKKGFEKYYNGKAMVCYASKALSCKSIYNIIDDEGLGIDVVSKGELYTALKSGFPAKKILFHGNNKSLDEIQYAIENKVHRIVVDNKRELELINNISADQNVITPVMLRITPGIDVHTHEFVKTGVMDSKFGFMLETGEAFDAVESAAKYSNIELKGIHCHIGSQILEVDPYILATRVMLNFVMDIKDRLGVTISEINLGGGFGIKYTDEDIAINCEDYIYAITSVIKDFCKDKGIERPFVMIEPGRSIIGEAGVTLYSIGNIKKIPETKDYIVVDGGMTDNPRYALYKSKYDMTIANKASEDKKSIYSIAGKCCESGDLLGENIKLQNADFGDVLAVFGTGAYNYSMASNYNRIPRPAVITVKSNNSRLIISRESLDDIIKNDI